MVINVVFVGKHDCLGYDIMIDISLHQQLIEDRFDPYATAT